MSSNTIGTTQAVAIGSLAKRKRRVSVSFAQESNLTGDWYLDKDESDDEITQTTKQKRSERISNINQTESTIESSLVTAANQVKSPSSKITIIPSTELQLLRDDLIIAERNNQVLRDHNLDLVNDNMQLEQELATERYNVALLHGTNKEWVEIERKLKEELGIMILNLNNLARENEKNKIGNAPLVNRGRQLEGLVEALSARIRGLENEVKGLKEERERKKSVYPPL